MKDDIMLEAIKEAIIRGFFQSFTIPDGYGGTKSVGGEIPRLIASVVKEIDTQEIAMKVVAKLSEDDYDKLAEQLKEQIKKGLSRYDSSLTESIAKEIAKTISGNKQLVKKIIDGIDGNLIDVQVTINKN